MKLNLENFLLKYSSEISQAKANNFEALIIPIYDNDVYPLNNINDEDFIYEIESLKLLSIIRTFSAKFIAREVQ